MYEIFEKLLEKHGVTAYRVAKDTGITTATLTSWKQGKYVPKQEKLQKLADYFGVPIEYFYDAKLDIETKKDLKEEQEDRLISYTIAAHKNDNGHWTKDELAKIEEYKQLLLAARNNRK